MSESKKKYKLGVAFGGGGARGAAQCGALQAFHEYGITPDVVTELDEDDNGMYDFADLERDTQLKKAVEVMEEKLK